MGYDVAFAKRCFPARASLIDELAAVTGNVRDLCYDLATAEADPVAYAVLLAARRGFRSVLDYVSRLLQRDVFRRAIFQCRLTLLDAAHFKTWFGSKIR
ncbi:hypothetical protein PZN02_004722 [Sinorhizobium garamanticum]|uniref:Uncharacterized protein n=1 Tax=Sinorhizobium garamanticum TaxID=680247 RepID=A0ABY8DJK8_9HYPH|nr:hypothetical protein [Sinorhizobium garamanticum]WEX91101.1 hypothetical protein PZN02_004722 [Sinorhizobium garamanticum]